MRASVVRRAGVTIAFSTDGRAPALAGLLREALDAWLPADLDTWMAASDEARREWKRSRVPMEERRPMLLETLNRLYEKESSQIRTSNSQLPAGCDVEFGSWNWALGLTVPVGRVSLVGAGPGDPELWTVRALRRVEEADLVLYDALVDAEALRRLTRAQCFCVGKRAGRASVKQEHDQPAHGPRGSPG